MSVAKKLGCALILLSIVSVLIWLIIGLTEARDELRDLKTELGKAEKEGQMLKFEMAESQAKLVQAKNESKEVEQLQNDLKILENLMIQNQNEKSKMEEKLKNLQIELDKKAENDSKIRENFVEKLEDLQEELDETQTNATILQGNFENGFLSACNFSSARFNWVRSFLSALFLIAHFY